MSVHKENVNKARSAVKMGTQLRYSASIQPKMGEVFLELTDAKTGRIIERRHKKNVITNDAGILAAMLFQDRGGVSRGICMLAIGTGARGALLNPDAADPRQRRLEGEIARKSFASIVYRKSDGSASAVPTNIVDFTTTYAEAEAVGPLNEMGLMSPLSDNINVQNPMKDANGALVVFPDYDTTIDVSQYDVMANYLTFPVISKPSTALLTITWRLTF